MRIAIDIRHLTSPNPTGIGRYTISLINALAPLAPDIHFLVVSSGTKKQQKYIPNWNFPNIHPIHIPIPNKLLKSLFLLKGGPNFESLLSQTPDIWLFPNLNTVKTELPFILTIHDLSFIHFPEFFTKKQLLWHKLTSPKKQIEKAKNILCVSESTKNDVTRLFKTSNNLHVTQLGIKNTFSPDPAPSDKNYLNNHNISFPYFLFLGTIEPRKNLTALIEAYDQFALESRSQNSLNIPHLVIAGASGWKNKDTGKALARARFRDQIHLLGYIPEKHKPALLRNTNALFMPSFYEGFGLPALEAAACGAPVVCSFTSSLPEAVKDGAILIDPMNQMDLIQAMHALEDIKLPKKLTKEAKEIGQIFTWTETAKKTLEVIREM